MSKVHGVKRGFTLIELLVVIAIMAMLMSILMPALGRARKMGHRVVCMSNVRRLGVSAQLYFEANNGEIFPERIRDKSWVLSVGPYVRKQARWQWFISDGMGYVINPNKYATQADFDAALEMDNDQFLCPTFKSVSWVRDIRNGAYGFNFQYLSNNRTEGPGGACANFPNKISRIKRASDTIIFGDSRGAGIPHGLHAYLMDPPKMAVSRYAKTFSPKGITNPEDRDGGADRYSPADARHLGKACIAFLDGHAQAMTYEEMGYAVDPDTKRPVEKANEEIGGPGNNRLWSGTGSDEPSYN